MNDGRYLEPISPQGPDVLTNYDVERLEQVERMMAEIDRDFKKRDANNMCLKTAAALQPDSRPAPRNMGSYIFPNEHADINPRRPATTVPVNASRPQGPTPSSMDETISRMIHATVYQTIEKLHEDGLLLCKSCLTHRR